MLRHADMQTTMKHYTDVTQLDTRAAVERVRPHRRPGGLPGEPTVTVTDSIALTCTAGDPNKTKNADDDEDVSHLRSRGLRAGTPDRTRTCDLRFRKRFGSPQRRGFRAGGGPEAGPPSRTSRRNLARNQRCTGPRRAGPAPLGARRQARQPTRDARGRPAASRAGNRPHATAAAPPDRGVALAIQPGRFIDRATGAVSQVQLAESAGAETDNPRHATPRRAPAGGIANRAAWWAT